MTCQLSSNSSSIAFFMNRAMSLKYLSSESCFISKIKIQLGNFLDTKFRFKFKSVTTISFQILFRKRLLTICFSANFKCSGLMFVTHIGEPNIRHDHIEILIFILWNLRHCKKSNIFYKQL